ncbi:Neutrophil cytosol factor 1-like [Oopsacas minuta]|uniref:Neutrophil cytosol factor 1-like n=1 Tax=Oopsacas minuta TaxID=111878 RepID=A0AAV7JJV7_9METZ|nr:Neutrophil cytosol factor 1-like [Oopsacas minuta]
MALKYTAHSQFTAPCVTQIEVTSYVKDDRTNSKKYRYELFVEWSDSARYSLSRLYSDFYEFQSELEAMFPVQAGQISEKERVLPLLPSKKSSIFKTTSPKDMQEKMQQYLNSILKLDEFILRSSVINSFFKLKDEYDHKLRGKGQKASLHPLGHTGGVVIEEFVAVADFKAKEKSNQLSFKKGDVLSVLVREGGWWFCECQGKSGWAPSTFLEELDTSDAIRDSDVQPIQERNEGKYRAVAPYAGIEGQHSCVPGDIFLVLESDPDGWWLALKLGVESDGELLEAWIPAAYLEALDEEFEDDNKDTIPEKYYVIEGYVAKSEDELSLDKGDIIEVLKINQDGWWFCKYGELSGFFPAFNIEPVDSPATSVVITSTELPANGIGGGGKYNRNRNVAASTTVFNKVKDFRASGRNRNKRTTVRQPPPRISSIPKVNSVASDNFNLSKGVRESVSSYDLNPSDYPSTSASEELKTFKEGLQVANPAPDSDVPVLGHVDATEVTKVKSLAKQKALITRNQSKMNVHILMQQVEQKKRALTSLTFAESMESPTMPPLGQEGNFKRQDMKLESLKSQVSEMNLSVKQMNIKIDQLEFLMKEISTKLDSKI